MNCLQYKNYMLIPGKEPVLTKQNQQSISTIVTKDNVKEIMSFIDKITN